ncbi:MAG: VWA domain-containing protein, partial [Halieaceae bacterium]|nr:VWA domain-containing protein [Halieaceae bacterium]
GWSTATDQVPDAAAITPLMRPAVGSDAAPVNPIEVTASINMGMPLARVDASYHEIILARDDGRYDIRLVGAVVEMDRDFVLKWQPVTGSTPQAAIFTEQVDGQHYGLLMVVPPTLVGAQANVSQPREMIYVIDTSGSMGGVSIDQARESLSMALRQLRPEDRFNIIEFNSSYRALYSDAVPASRHFIGRAEEFVRQLSAGGGTEMLPALTEALAVPAGEDNASRLRQVIFITDGAVGNELQLFEAIASSIGNNRLFTVSIGSAPNDWFMRKAAQFGRGSHTHIGDLGEVGEKMSHLFRQISSPVVLNMSVDWPEPVEAWPERIPDLYSGDPVMVAVKFNGGALGGDVLVRGQIAGSPWSRTLRMASPSQRENPGVASLWARQKIASLLDQRLLGEREEQVRKSVLEVALAHSLMSPYTSFIAVEERISRPAGKGLNKAPVPNTRPRGQSPQAFAYPRTATSGPLNLFLGSLLLFLAMMVYVMRRPEVDHVPAVQV